MSFVQVVTNFTRFWFNQMTQAIEEIIWKTKHRIHKTRVTIPHASQGRTVTGMCEAGRAEGSKEWWRLWWSRAQACLKSSVSAGFSHCGHAGMGSRYFNRKHLCRRHFCRIADWLYSNSAVKDETAINKRGTLTKIKKTWKMNNKSKKTLLWTTKYLKTFEMCVDSWQHWANKWFYLVGCT